MTLSLGLRTVTPAFLRSKMWSFEIPAGEMVALLGPSGCGKSTVLRAIAGLIQPKSRLNLLGWNRISPRCPARSRGIGMVFQNYALFPHLTVAENIAYPLACQQVPRAGAQGAGRRNCSARAA